MALFLPILVALAAVVSCAVVNVKRKSEKKSEGDDLTKSEKVLRVFSILFNVVWCASFIFTIVLSAWAGAFTIHFADTGFEKMLAYFVQFLIIATPVAVIVCVCLSFAFRKKKNMLTSFLIQLLPLAVLTTAMTISAVFSEISSP